MVVEFEIGLTVTCWRHEEGFRCAILSTYEVVSIRWISFQVSETMVFSFRDCSAGSLTSAPRSSCIAACSASDDRSSAKSHQRNRNCADQTRAYLASPERQFCQPERGVAGTATGLSTYTRKERQSLLGKWRVMVCAQGASFCVFFLCARPTPQS